MDDADDSEDAEVIEVDLEVVHHLDVAMIEVDSLEIDDLVEIPGVTEEADDDSKEDHLVQIVQQGHLIDQEEMKITLQVD